jgi:hypothetical protein
LLSRGSDNLHGLGPTSVSFVPFELESGSWGVFIWMVPNWRDN